MTVSGTRPLVAVRKRRKARRFASPLCCAGICFSVSQSWKPSLVVRRPTDETAVVRPNHVVFADRRSQWGNGLPILAHAVKIEIGVDRNKKAIFPHLALTVGARKVQILIRIAPRVQIGPVAHLIKGIRILLVDNLIPQNSVANRANICDSPGDPGLIYCRQVSWYGKRSDGEEDRNDN